MVGQYCRSFLWGGDGVANFEANDGRSDFFCVCGDEGWLDVDILGRPSCVPTKVHLIFGAVGVASSIAGICHALYQLIRQVKFHKHHVGAAASPVEVARRRLHVLVIAHDGITVAYFIMFLGLRDDLRWLSIMLLAGVFQITSGMTGLLTMRMWIYTNDHLLLRETPEILAISDALERPTGQRISHVVGSIGGTIAFVLAATNHTRSAVRVAAVGFMCLITFCNLVIWKCGTSLLRTIGKAMQQSTPGLSPGNSTQDISASTPPRGSSAAKAEGKEKEGRYNTAGKSLGKGSCLVVARRKIKMSLRFCLGLATKTMLLLLLSVSSVGTAAPLIFFGLPMAFAPLIWLAFNIQMHAGRSRQGASQGAAVSADSLASGRVILSKMNSIIRQSSPAVLPTETPFSP